MRSSLSRSFYSSALIIECFQNKVPIKASEVMEKGDDFFGSFIGASQASKNSSVVLLWWIFSSSSLDQQVRFGWKRRSSEIALSISAKFKTGGGWGPSLVLVIIIIIIKIHWVIKGVILLLWRGFYNGLNVATVSYMHKFPTVSTCRMVAFVRFFGDYLIFSTAEWAFLPSVGSWGNDILRTHASFSSNTCTLYNTAGTFWVFGTDSLFSFL